jgi:hypothetical protein
MMTAALDSLALAALAAVTPSPTPAPDFDPNSVTPTWVGFAITFLVAAATVLLILDMVRRIRRTRYRGEIQELLDAEREAADRAGGDAAGAKPEPEG